MNPVRFPIAAIAPSSCFSWFRIRFRSLRKSLSAFPKLAIGVRSLSLSPSLDILGCRVRIISACQVIMF